MGRFEQKRVAMRLIGEDRKGTKRDDRYHSGYEQYITELAARVAKIMREGLTRLTKMGI